MIEEGKLHITNPTTKKKTLFLKKLIYQKSLPILVVANPIIEESQIGSFINHSDKYLNSSQQNVFSIDLLSSPSVEYFCNPHPIECKGDILDLIEIPPENPIHGTELTKEAINLLKEPTRISKIENSEITTSPISPKPNHTLPSTYSPISPISPEKCTISSKTPRKTMVGNGSPSPNNSPSSSSNTSSSDIFETGGKRKINAVISSIQKPGNNNQRGIVLAACCCEISLNFLHKDSPIISSKIIEGLIEEILKLDMRSGVEEVYNILSKMERFKDSLELFQVWKEKIESCHTYEDMEYWSGMCSLMIQKEVDKIQKEMERNGHNSMCGIVKLTYSLLGKLISEFSVISFEKHNGDACIYHFRETGREYGSEIKVCMTLLNSFQHQFIGRFVVGKNLKQLHSIQVFKIKQPNK